MIASSRSLRVLCDTIETCLTSIVSADTKSRQAVVNQRCWFQVLQDSDPGLQFGFAGLTFWYEIEC